MAFEKILGQERPKKILANALANGRLAQSYLFYGPPGVGKEMMAFEIAKAINCHDPKPTACGSCPSCKKIEKLQHPDLQYIFPVPSGLKPEELRDILKEKAEHPHQPIVFDRRASISIERVRAIKEEASYRVYEGKRKVFIIRNVEAMTVEAANAFLKLLEEPSPQTMLILTSPQPQALLPTIVSRCQQVRFGLLAEATIEKILGETYALGTDQARLISRLAAGSMSQAFDLMSEDMPIVREQVWQLFVLAHGQSMLPVFDLEREIIQARNVQSIERALRLLLTLYRDVLLVKQQKQALVVNLEYLERIDKASERHSVASVIRSMQEIERSVQLLPRNVNLMLLMTNLIIKLQDIAASPKAKIASHL
jgi:DNA polymerase III subunit delta'